MSKKYVLLYSTVDGHTKKICERLASILESSGHSTDAIELHNALDLDFKSFDRVIIGASIRYGKHRPEVMAFIEKNREAIEARKGAFFSVNAVARKADKNESTTNPYVRKFFENTEWRPVAIGVFGGRIDYAKYGFVDRSMIRFIMWLTNGPTALDSDTDFTDWDEVDAFGRSLMGLS